jgi:hypothetical protein
MSEIQVNTINEYTGANGVTIDGVLIKDGEVDGVDVSAITQGITEADMWETSASISSTGVITTNLQRSSQTTFNYLGTGMTESSGIFTFPSTGYWWVWWSAKFRGAAGAFGDLYCDATTNNSTYTAIGVASGTPDGVVNTGNQSSLLDVTDTSNIKVRFRYDRSGSTTIDGGETRFYFQRLGNT